MRFIGLAMVLALAACGSDDTRAEFAGTWMPAPGAALTGSCSDGSQINSMLTSAEVFAQGVDADLTATTGSCTIRYDVNGTKATARSGQSCTSMAGGLTSVLTVQQNTLTLGSDRKTMTESAMGTIQLSGAATGTCTVAATYTLSKISN